MKTYKLVDSNSTRSKINLVGGLIISGNKVRLTEEDINKIYTAINLRNIQENNFADVSKDLVKSTYGEMTYPAVEDLIKLTNLGKGDKFVDLGSGNGKVVMQVFANSDVSQAYGVEFFPERSQNSEYALKQLYKQKKELLDDDRIISYQLQNIKDVHYLDDATVIFACSTCYPPELMDVVYDKIKDSKKIRSFITHKPHDKFKTILPNHTTTCFPCTWSKNLTWNIYSK